MKKIITLLIAFSFVFSPFATFAQSTTDLQAQINSLLQTIKNLQSQLVSIQNNQGSTKGETTSVGGSNAGASVSCLTLKNSLYLGLRDSDTEGEVSLLQKFLQSQGDFTHPVITGYFGPATERAIQKWQTRNAVVSSGSPETTGFGVVGPQTRDVIRKFGCDDVVSVTNSDASAVSVGQTNFVDLKLETPNDTGFSSQKFVRVIIAASERNKEVAYWKLSVSCPAGVISTNEKENGGTLGQTNCKEFIFNSNGAAQDYLVLTQSFKNTSSSDAIVVFSLQAYASSGLQLGGDKEGLDLKGVGQSSAVVLYPYNKGEIASLTPTISGTASGVNQVGISISNSGGKIYGSGFIPVVNGKWSVTVSPALTPGIHGVYVYDTNNNQLASSGFSIVSSTVQPLISITSNVLYTDASGTKIEILLSAPLESGITGWGISLDCPTGVSAWMKVSGGCGETQSTSNGTNSLRTEALISNPTTSNVLVDIVVFGYDGRATSYSLDGPLVASKRMTISILPNKVVQPSITFVYTTPDHYVGLTYKNLPLNSQVRLVNAVTNEPYLAQNLMVSSGGSSSTTYNMPIPADLPNGTYYLRVNEYSKPDTTVARSDSFYVYRATSAQPSIVHLQERIHSESPLVVTRDFKTSLPSNTQKVSYTFICHNNEQPQLTEEHGGLSICGSTKDVYSQNFIRENSAVYHYFSLTGKGQGVSDFYGINVSITTYDSNGSVIGELSSVLSFFKG